METKKVKLFIDFCKANKVDLPEVCGFDRNPKLGDFHFSDGTYSSTLIKGRVVDGIYIADGCSITRFESENKSGRDANIFCRANKVALPPLWMKNRMMTEYEFLNTRLKLIGWPTLYAEPADYWSTESPKGSFKRVRGFIETKGYVIGPTEKDIADILQNPQNVLKRYAELLKIPSDRTAVLLDSLLKLPTAGKFLLENDDYVSFAEIPRSMRVKGIFLDSNTYLHLAMISNTVCLEDFPNRKLPSRQEIELLDKVIPQVDYALSELKLDHLRFRDNALKKCWWEMPSSERFPGEKRRLIRIDSWGRLSNAEKKLLELKSILL